MCCLLCTFSFNLNANKKTFKALHIFENRSAVVWANIANREQIHGAGYTADRVATSRKDLLSIFSTTTAEVSPLRGELWVPLCLETI